jgi:hypothetical protein
VEDARPCSEIYKNKVTELWYTMREFGRNDQIRGLRQKEQSQFCKRRLIPKVDSRSKLCVESKKDFKKRTAGDSPDDADASVCALDFLRHKAAVFPGKRGATTRWGEEERSLWFDQMRPPYQGEAIEERGGYLEPAIQER